VDKPLEVIEVLPNIAPILDFTVMDMGNRDADSQLGNEFSSGQARIVAGCGALTAAACAAYGALFTSRTSGS